MSVRRVRYSLADLAEPPVLVVGSAELRRCHVERFRSYLSEPDERGCVLWTASVDKAGYGQFRVGTKELKTHRIAWWLENGPLPEGLEPDHTCEVERCCNAQHLEPVTHAENMRRYGARLTHCQAGRHRWDEQKPIIKRGGRRQCRPCRNENRRTSDGQHWCSKRDSCKNGHEFTPENTARRPDGGRRCLACRRAASCRYYRRKQLHRNQR